MPELRKTNILIVDDDEEVRRYLQTLLQRKGFNTYLASDGEEALNKIKELDVQIVICDIKMPKLNGIEFLKTIHALNINVQVIIITGVYDLNNYNEAIKQSICGYLIKPFSSKELMESILLAQRNILEKEATIKKAASQLKRGKTNYVLLDTLKKLSFSLLTTFLIYLLFVPFVYLMPFSRNLNWSIYGQLQKAQNLFSPPPAAIKDIVLVLIDDETINKMSQHWPYSTSTFLDVINNLKKAQPKVIAFDFSFMGNSTPEETNSLTNALLGGSKVIFGYEIDKDKKMDFSPPQLGANTASGFVNSLQDQDGIIRRGLIYLKNGSNLKNYFFVWEMQVLKAAEGINMPTFDDKKSLILFQNSAKEEWSIPVDREIKSFLIHFRAHTNDFKRLSFYCVFTGDFNPKDVEGKIVFLSVTSFLLGDRYNTVIGPLPGIILKANAFLTLYSRDFLKEIPLKAELFFIIFGLFLLALSFFFFKDWQKILVAVALIAVFLIASYMLLMYNYIWNYSIFPSAVILAYLFLTAIQKIWKVPV